MTRHNHRYEIIVNEKIDKPMFASRLEELMIGMDVSNREFAKQLYLDPHNITYWVHGERLPKIDAIVQICNKYNVSADWLLGLSDTKSCNKL